MTTEERAAVMAIFRKHGYNNFSDDPKVVRVLGPQQFREIVAAHPKKGTYTLYVRRGGAAYLVAVAGDIGGSFEGAALTLPGLDFAGLDRKLTELSTSLEAHPVQS